MSSTRFEEFTAHGSSGTEKGVDLLMAALIEKDDLATLKLVDYALGLVNTRPGKARISYYLFNGATIQRNYAALYFKRRGYTDLLDEAVGLGKIDTLQAYAK